MRGRGHGLAARRVEPAGFDPDFFERLYDVEDQLFWSVTRNRMIATLVGQITARLPNGHRVLEVGCGTGNVLRALEGACPGGVVVGMDLFLQGLRYARRRTSCPLVQGDISKLPFRPGFDLVGVFDVLEHLPDDTGALRDLRNLLSERGQLILTVPAHQKLWSYYDEAMHHYRRYGSTDLRRKLESAGYEVDYLTYFMLGTLPLLWLGRRLAPLIKRRSAPGTDRAHDLATGDLRVPPSANMLLKLLLVPEVHLVAHRRSIPTGSSLLAICRKHEEMT
jgi:SAM-dependent methyltransferase